MEKTVLPKGFFKKNPLQELSAAIFLDGIVQTELIDGLNNSIFDIANEVLPDERLAQVEQDKQEVAALSSGEDIARYMRKRHDILASPALCEKALSLIEDAAPHIIKRYMTTAQDTFIELAFRIFIRADKRYAEELYSVYHNIRDPYARAVACLLFGRHNMEPSVPLLLREYKRFQTDYPDEDFEQFPLLALYILFDVA